MRNRYEKDEITQYFEEDNMRFMTRNEELEMLVEYERYIRAPRWITVLAISIMLALCATAYWWVVR